MALLLTAKTCWFINCSAPNFPPIIHPSIHFRPFPYPDLIFLAVFKIIWAFHPSPPPHFRRYLLIMALLLTAKTCWFINCSAPNFPPIIHPFIHFRPFPHPDSIFLAVFRIIWAFHPSPHPIFADTSFLWPCLWLKNMLVHKLFCSQFSTAHPSNHPF